MEQRNDFKEFFLFFVSGIIGVCLELPVTEAVVCVLEPFCMGWYPEGFSKRKGR